jgi:type IV secretion system protein TrbG
MNRKGTCSLAVCLLIASAAGANEESQTPAATPDGSIPNLPPELAIALQAQLPAAPGSTDSPAQPAAVAIDEPKERSPSQEAEVSDEDCEVEDCSDGEAPVVSAPKRKDPRSIPLGKPARLAIAESQEWAENPAAVPVRDSGGRMLFPFGESIPTIVCAPLRVCDIQLQKGETVLGKPHIGDSIRWKVARAVSGSGDQQVTHLIVKPTEEGLDTNLIVPTDRHTYHIRLVSSVDQYVASVAFDYPDDEQQNWNATTNAGAGSDSLLTKGDMPTVAVNRLNFNYRIKVVQGKPAFKPLRAMDDGYHTYIAMNDELPQSEAPALIGISPGGEEQMINYRMKGNLYIVDGTVHKLALISGVGRKQQRVELTRNPCETRGWLGMCWDARE